jgi:hypothetical protein
VRLFSMRVYQRYGAVAGDVSVQKNLNWWTRGLSKSPQVPSSTPKIGLRAARAET